MGFSRLTMFVRGAWRKLPVELLVVAMAAGGAIGLLHDESNPWFLRLALAGLVIGPLAVAAHRLGRARQALVIAGATAGVLGLLAAEVPSWRALDDARVWWPYGLGLIAALLVPFATAPQFTRFVRRFFEETTTWALLGACAFAALGVIVLALDELFDLRFGDAYCDAKIVLAAAIVLLYLDRLLADDTAGRVPELWRRLATVIGAPFVSAMLVILVAYEALALVRGELPRNMLSPLILAAGLVGFVTTLILTAVLDAEVGTAALAPADPHRWARRPSIRLARAFPLILLALIPMAAWALQVRIEEHGVTPFRAVRAAGLLCLAVLSLGSAVRWWRKRPPLTWQVPAVGAGFALVLGFGPLSAIELSIRSQAAELARRLDAAHVPHVVAPQPIAPALVLDPETYGDIQDQIHTVFQLGGEPALRRVLGGAVAPCATTWAEQGCLEGLGIVARGHDVPVPPAGERFELVTRARVATGAGELEAVRLEREAGSAPQLWRDGGPTLVLLADAVVLASAGDEVARGSLTELLAYHTTDEALPPRAVELRRKDGAIAGELVVFRLAGRASEPAQAIELTGVVIWRR